MTRWMDGQSYHMTSIGVSNLCLQFQSLRYKFYIEEHILTRLARKNRHRGLLYLYEKKNIEGTSLTHL